MKSNECITLDIHGKKINKNNYQVRFIGVLDSLLSDMMLAEKLLNTKKDTEYIDSIISEVQNIYLVLANQKQNLVFKIVKIDESYDAFSRKRTFNFVIYNKLRTKTREVELLAVRLQNSMDYSIIQYLNNLSREFSNKRFEE